MKTLVLVLALVSLAPAPRAYARDHDREFSHASSCCRPPVHVRARHDVRGARIAIDTRDGEATLLLTDDAIAVQLSEGAIGRIRREFRDEREEEDDFALARAIKSVVLNGVQAILEHSAECRLRDVDDVSYRDRHLTVTTRGGECIFADMDINDDDMMSGFRERDALAFVREFHRLKSGGR